MKKILIVVGTRPNFIKITQFKKIAAESYPNIDIKIVHTGQHFDLKMADVFFQQLNIYPDYFLNIPSSSANSQMAEIMLRLEQVITRYGPDLLLVVGDVNSTFAAALAAQKIGVKIGHIESGLRSFDREMPEEINRILTDEISDYYFVTEESGKNNLLREDKAADSIFFVGNTMIDTLVAFKEQVDDSKILDLLGIKPKDYILVTMHRPSNVDEQAGLYKLVQLLQRLAMYVKVVFPIHPRTKSRLEQNKLYNKITENGNILVNEPLDYFSFQKLISECMAVVTDSGGIQEETTFKQVPCLTLRENTERPSTINIGTNKLIPFDVDTVVKEVDLIRGKKSKKGAIPPFWDGKATERILEVISNKILV